VDGPDYREIERRIENGQEPTLALDLDWPTCVCSRGTRSSLAECGSIVFRIDQPVFAGREIGRANNRATATARFVDTG
jgi:hypothetical protein